MLAKNALHNYLCTMTSHDAAPEQVDSARQDRQLDTGALRALAHPLRIEIYDLLSQRGPQTASSLAAMTGESSGATSYHLRELAKHELIREVDGRGTGRERWWERPTGGVSLTNPEALRTPAGKAATQLVMSEFLTRRHQQLMRYVNEALLSAEALDESEAMIATSTLRLTREQTEELSTELRALITRFSDLYRDQEGDGVRVVSVRTDVFPLPEGGVGS